MSDNYEGLDESDDDESYIADEVAYADTGRPWAAKAIKSHPMYAATRRHLAANPLPVQSDRRSA